MKDSKIEGYLLISSLVYFPLMNTEVLVSVHEIGPSKTFLLAFQEFARMDGIPGRYYCFWDSMYLEWTILVDIVFDVVSLFTPLTSH